MKQILFISITTMLILSACIPQAQPTEESQIPVDSPTSDSVDEFTPAERAAVTLLSSDLNLPLAEISVISTEAVEWPDGCLGVQKEGMMCTQAVVPGYRIVLQAGDEQYEFHTNEKGTQVVQAAGAPPAVSVEDRVVRQLAKNLGLDVDAISVVSSTAVEFPDACLGVAMPGIVCAQAVTPGMLIVLKANELEFEYHVSKDGSFVQPATLALAWTREGGIAGFCDSVLAYLSGEVLASNCRSRPNQASGYFAELLTPAQIKEFSAWYLEFGETALDVSDPAGVSDRMINTLEFFGNGTRKPGKADQQALFDWADEVFQKLFS